MSGRRRLAFLLMTGLVAAGPATGPATKPAGRTPHPRPVGDAVIEMTIAELGNFDYDPGQHTPIPDDVKALSGHVVRLRGFMIPLDQEKDINRFALVPTLDHLDGLAPKIQQTIVVNCLKGRAVAYDPNEIVVQGKLTVGEVKDDGFVVCVFTVDTASVKPFNK